MKWPQKEKPQRPSDRPPLNPGPFVSQFAALRAIAGSNAWLLAHRWPGNVRELENVLRLALQRRHVGDLRIEDLPAEVRPAAARNAATALQRLEAEAIVEALAAADGNKRRAAQALGVSRSTLYRKLRAYGIELDRLAY